MVSFCPILAVCLPLFYLLATSHGRLVIDEEEDNDDKWPVLCPPNTFYSRQQELCLTCSRCQINQIITSPCYGLHDTQCGPFYDFKNILSDDTKHETEDLTSENEINKNSNLPSDNKNVSNRLSSDKNSTDTVEYSEAKWRSLTIALIVLTSVFVIIVIMSVVYILRKRNVSDKQIKCEYSTPPENV